MRTRHLVLAALVLQLSPRVTASTPCSDDDTIESCYAKNQSSPSQSAEAGVQKEVTSGLAAKSTGADSFGSRLASTIKDFNPLFKGLIQTSDVAADGRSLTLDVNLKSLVGTASGWQLQAVAREPEVYGALEQALPAATRSTRSAALKNELGELDDVTGVLSWSPQNSYLGRTFSGNTDLFSALILELDEQAAKGESAGSVPPDLLFTLLDVLKGENLPADAETMKFSNISNPDVRAAAKKYVEQISVAQEKVDARFRALATAHNLIAMADLINNQPQVYVSGSYRSRATIAGPDEITIKASYEHGFANLNGLRRDCRCADDAAKLLESLPRYSYKARSRSALKHADRLAVSVEYTQVQKYQIALPSDGVNLDLKSSHTFVASFAYGRYVSFDANGNEVGRFDAKANYEDYGTDPTRQRRAVASVAYTQKINKDWSIPIGLTWANREEFVGDVQKKLSAHLGLSYKLPWKK